MPNLTSALDLFDILNVLSITLQIQSLDELHRQKSTDDIYKELQAQDRQYLTKLLDNQERILCKLDKLLSD